MLPRLLILALVLGCSAKAADWSQWRGPLRTGHVPHGQPVPAALPNEPKIVWRHSVGGGFASPIVSGARVFHLHDENGSEVAQALDAATGKVLWSETIFSSHRDGFGIGPRCTPVADGDRVYFQAAKGELQCRSAADGKLLWRTNFVDDHGAIYIGEKGKAAGASRHGATGSPLIEGENIIVQVGGPDGASIVAFNKTSGKVLWKSQNDQTAYAAPVIAEIAGRRQFISFTAEGLIGLDPVEGGLLWRVPLKTALGRHVTTPVVFEDLVIVASHQVGLVATRIVAGADGLRAEEAWSSKAHGINFSSPVAVGQHLYGLGAQKNIICIDMRTGELAWEKEGLIQTSADKAEAAFLVLGSNILTLTDSGELILFAADPKEYRELGKVQVAGSTWCNPAYADGRLYLRDQKELLCAELQ
jgi:outer membrane protein assembly factor BamB